MINQNNQNSNRIKICICIQKHAGKVRKKYFYLSFRRPSYLHNLKGLKIPFVVELEKRSFTLQRHLKSRIIQAGRYDQIQWLLKEKLKTQVAHAYCLLLIGKSSIRNTKKHSREKLKNVLVRKPGRKSYPFLHF